MQLRLVLRGAPVEHIGLEGIARLLESCDERTSTQEPQEAMLVAATPPTGEAERLAFRAGFMAVWHRDDSWTFDGPSAADKEPGDDRHRATVAAPPVGEAEPSVIAQFIDPAAVIYLPDDVRSELFRCAASNGRISVEYLVAIYRCGVANGKLAAEIAKDAAIASPAPQPADGVTQAQHEIVASIIDMVEHDQSRRAEMNRLRADALRAVLARALASGGLVKYYQGASYTAEKTLDELRDWRATVTAALGREGGAHYPDVPKHIREMRRALDGLPGHTCHVSSDTCGGCEYAMERDHRLMDAIHERDDALRERDEARAALAKYEAAH